MNNIPTSPANNNEIWEVIPQVGPAGIERYRIMTWNAERTIARTIASTTTATPKDEANAQLMCGARMMREASQDLYDCINAILMGESLDDESNEYLEQEMNKLEEAWRVADGRASDSPESNGNAA